jgi:hypothetical protein
MPGCTHTNAFSATGLGFSMFQLQTSPLHAASGQSLSLKQGSPDAGDCTVGFTEVVPPLLIAPPRPAPLFALQPACSPREGADLPPVPAACGFGARSSSVRSVMPPQPTQAQAAATTTTRLM